MPRSFAFALAKFAEAGHVSRIDRRHVMRRAQAVAKRALPLRSPHNSVDVIRTRIVLNQPGQKISVVRIVHAQRLRIPSIQIPLLQFLDVRQVGAKYVLQPADHLHPALLRRRQHFGQNVQVAMVGRAGVFENRILVVLRMRRGEVPAVKVEIVFLLAMIRQRLARNLPSRNSSSVGEHCKEQGIHASTLLKLIQHLLGAFIHERNCSHLDANGFRRDSSLPRCWHR